ncbi:MAG: NAD(P)-binding domain-containing protein [Propionibacteriaceae bacterium]|nr:NAD(P)-binding domain-containing protein [Propionibacteriaceae bacterium]
MTTIGVLSPGAMGAALGRAWQRGGAKVVTTVAGRSARTQALAEGLDRLESVAEVVAAADVVVSVVPPAQVVANAEQIAKAARRAGVRPIVADLNAVSLPTMDRVAGLLAEAGCAVVDGSISGMPPGPTAGEATRVYLSGADAPALAGFDAPGLRSIVVGAEPGQASAIKMCTAAVYKGLTALMIQSLRTADSHGVADFVAADWADMLGALGADGPHRIALAVAKSDRFPDEMREIAATQEAAGWGGELYESIARVFEAAYRTELGGLTPEQSARIGELAQVVEALRTPRD